MKKIQTHTPPKHTQTHTRTLKEHGRTATHFPRARTFEQPHEELGLESDDGQRHGLTRFRTPSPTMKR